MSMNNRDNYMATLNKDLVLLTAKSKLEKDGFEITDKELQKEVTKLSTNMDFLEAVNIVYAKLSAGVQEEKVYKSFIVDWSRTW
jgi:hypothetical protein